MRVRVAEERTFRLGRSAGSQASATALRVAGVLVVGQILFLRFYHLDDMPSDIYRDIVILFDYVKAILDGEWPITFSLSAGPLYHYLVTPFVLVLGLNYLTLKIASVVVSLATLAAVWLFARELGATLRSALLAVALAGVSSWFLIFSRLGNSQILTPLLACLSFYFLHRLLRTEGKWDLVGAAGCAALGLYCYPQTFFLAPAAFAVLLFYAWRRQFAWGTLLRFTALLVVCALPFAAIVLMQPGDFFSGYIGGKLTQGNPLAELKVLPVTVLKSLLMLHVQGDVVFRSNPHNLPHLDVVSGVFFILGVIFLLLKGNRQLIPFTLWPFLFLQVPSMLVLGQTIEVPSASRTLLIVPFVFVIAALGLDWLLDHLIRLCVRSRFAGLVGGRHVAERRSLLQPVHQWAAGAQRELCPRDRQSHRCRAGRRPGIRL